MREGEPMEILMDATQFFALMALLAPVFILLGMA